MNHVEILRSLIAYNTVNDPAKDLRPSSECPEFLKKYLVHSGFNAEVYEQKGFYSVLGIKGEGRPVTLLLAHFDVVPIGPGWESDPFALKIDQGMGYGRGAADDKGNVTALLLVANVLSKLSFSGTIAIAMTGDEEIGGANGAPLVREQLEKQNLFPDYLITADGVGMRIVTRRRNTCGITISVPKNLQAIEGMVKIQRFTTEYFDRAGRHSAYFLPGVDRHAFLAASNFLRHNLIYKLTSVKGSFVKSNVVPDWIELETIEPKQGEEKLEYDMNLTRLIQALLPICRLNFPTEPSDYGITICPNLLHETAKEWDIYFDARAMTTNVKAIEKALQNVLEKHLVGIDYQTNIQMGKAFMNTSTESTLVQTAQQIAESLGLNPRPIELGGASDTRHFSDQPIEAIDFGPIGYAVHGSNEHVLLDSIPRTAEFYTRLIETIHKAR